MAGGVPASLVFAASAFSQYLGADLAVSLFSLMPATSILVGAVVLGQLPSGWKVAGLVLVSVAVEAHRSPESGCAQHVRTRMPQNVSVHGRDADEVAIRIGNHEGSAKDIVVGFFNNCDAFCRPFLVDGIHRLQ